ncbi:MAG: hypothetical protein KGS72_11585, partial [Cyanobacteria bacterium REEB67]|nr:hypothetical protein [Cyanobacteria bacterium REEB67]
MIGVGEAIDPTSTFLGYAVPATRVSDLLNRKEKVFNFTYKGESAFDRDPIAVSLTTATITAGAYFLRKYAAPILRIGDAPDACRQLSNATRSDLFAPRSHYITAGLTDVAGVAGGVMSLIPRTRMIGYGVVGAKLLYDEAKAFMPDTQVLQNVHRTNGDKRLPFQWDIFNK